MTINELKNYRNICCEMAEIQQELDSKHYVSDTVKTCYEPSFTAYNRQVSGYVSNDNTISLLARLNTLKTQHDEIERYIQQIEDFQTKKIFELKYIKGKTFLQTAIKLGYGITESGVKMRVKRYLEKS